MAVLPQVIRFLPCIDAEADDEANRVTLIDPISISYLPKGTEYPSPIDGMYFYTHISSGLGSFYCRLEAKAETGQVVAKTKPIPVHFDADNRFIGFEFLIDFPIWEIPGPGLYQFALFANHAVEPIGIAEIRFIVEE